MEINNDIFVIEIASSSQTSYINFTINDFKSLKSTRFDLFLKNILDTSSEYSLSRSKIQELISTGQILVNDRTVKNNYQPNLNDRIKIIFDYTKSSAIEPYDYNLEILYEDEFFAAINKPAGLTVHPGANCVEKTLVNALVNKFGDSLSLINNNNRPGLVHRLDKDTTGVILVAKNDDCHYKLADLFKNRLIQKTYLAISDGYPSSQEGIINLNIKRSIVKRHAMTVEQSGKQAITHFKVMQYNNQYTLLELKPKTGRTHQLRVHLSYLSLPIVGDIVYNNKISGTMQFRHKYNLAGHLLHASQLSFLHPYTNEKINIEAKLPDYFNNAISVFLGGI